MLCQLNRRPDPHQQQATLEVRDTERFEEHLESASVAAEPVLRKVCSPH